MKRLALGAVCVTAACGVGLGGADAGQVREVAILLPYDGGRAVDEVRDASVPFDAGALPTFDAGAPFGNATFEVPRSDGGVEGMSCAWLDSPGNCWRAAMESVRGCLADAGVGRLSGDGRHCAFGNGATWVSSEAAHFAPRDGGEAGWTTALRVNDAAGRVCLETAYAFARSRLQTPHGTLHLRSTSLFEYELTCPDGRVFSDAADAGACGSFSLRFLFGGVPGFDFQCSDSACWPRATGTNAGAIRVATCAE